MNPYFWMNWVALLVIAVVAAAQVYTVWDNIWGGYVGAGWRYKWPDVFVAGLILVFMVSLAVLNLGFILGWWR